MHRCIDASLRPYTARVTSLAAGSIADAAMIIFAKKSKVMPIHKKTRTSATTDADVAKLNLVHMCEPCTREFTRLRGLKMHMTHWCDGGRTQRSRVGSLTDKAAKSSKRCAAEASLDKVAIGSDPPLENLPHFQYLGCRLQGDGSDEAGVGHRLDIAQSVFSSLSHLWDSLYVIGCTLIVCILFTSALLPSYINYDYRSIRSAV